MGEQRRRIASGRDSGPNARPEGPEAGLNNPTAEMAPSPPFVPEAGPVVTGCALAPGASACLALGEEAEGGRVVGTIAQRAGAPPPSACAGERERERERGEGERYTSGHEPFALHAAIC